MSVLFGPATTDPADVRALQALHVAKNWMHPQTRPELLHEALVQAFGPELPPFRIFVGRFFVVRRTQSTVTGTRRVSVTQLDKSTSRIWDWNYDSNTLQEIFGNYEPGVGRTYGVHTPEEAAGAVIRALH